MTYRQLNERTNQLARRIRKVRGVGSDDAGGHLCEAFVGRWWSGCWGFSKRGEPTVPLDPEYPKEHLAFMLVDAGAPALLTHSSLQGSLPAHTGKVVRLDTDWPLIAKGSVGNVTSPVRAEHLAYRFTLPVPQDDPKGR